MGIVSCIISMETAIQTNWQPLQTFLTDVLGSDKTLILEMGPTRVQKIKN